MTGETISHYRIQAALGSGGMGVVYRAEDTRLGRAVALKFLPAALGRDAQALERFRREARALSALNHPNICTVYDIGEDADGRPFLVMELLEGETLQQRLQRGALPAAETIELGAQIADGLDAAHAKGVVHRDLKPANLFLTQRGHAKILDFGLAKMRADDGGDAGEQATQADAGGSRTLTSPGLALGTIAYMSPEQALGKPLDARSDLFSLGVVLYEMAAGRVAFPGTTSAAVFDGILNRSPAPPPQLNPECPAGLEQVIRTLMEKDPGLRFQSAADLRSALRRLQRDSGPAAVAAPPAQSRPRRRWLLAGMAAAVVVVAAAGYTWVRSRAPRRMNAKDSVVLADFTNTTGDTMFDGTLRQALAVELEQSPYLNLVSDQTMAQTEQLMGMAPGAPVRGAAAQQLCLRTASAAVLAGSIAQVGGQYNLILQAVNCSTGDNLASTQRIAENKDQVLRTLGQLAADLRAKLGESLASMAQFNLPIEMVTTPSLAALKAYSSGRHELELGNFATAASLFQQALALDPNFAMAYASRGTAESDLSQGNASAQASADFTEAYNRRDHVSPRERFYITSHYDDTVRGDELQTERDYQVWEQTYPSDAIPYINACSLEGRLGQAAAAQADCAAAIRLDASNPLPLMSLTNLQLTTGDTAGAKASVTEALRRWPDSLLSHGLDLSLAEATGDDSRVTAASAWLVNHPGGAPLLHQQTMLNELADGRMAVLRTALRQAPNPQNPDDWITLALMDGLFGNVPAARSEVDTALRLGQDESTLSGAAQTLALIGDAARAEALIPPLQQHFGGTTMTQMVDLPVCRALIALARHQPQAAVTALAPAEPYELGSSSAGFPAYVRGLAWQQAKQPTAAAAEFQKVLRFGLPTPFTNPARLGLARAQAAQGQTVAARASYQTLLAAWQHADADLPLVAAARAEAARLSR